MDDIFAFLEALCEGVEDFRGEVVGRDTVGEYTIDTCETLDCGWETAVWKGGYPMIIVGRYDTIEEAEEGHEDWCAVCALRPVAAWSVQNDCIEYFVPSDAVEEDEDDE